MHLFITYILGCNHFIFLEKETCLTFFKWIENTFPPDPSVFGAKL